MVNFCNKLRTYIYNCFTWTFLFIVLIKERGDELERNMYNNKRQHVYMKEIKQVRDYGKRS